MTGEGAEQRRAAERGKKIWRRSEEHDGEHAERHADDGEQPMGIGAAGNRAVGEAERASDRGAGDEVQRRQRGEVEDESRAQEGQAGSAKPAIAAVRESISIEARREEQAAEHRADQKQRREAAGLRRGEMILSDERADPHRQGDEVDHAGAMRQHQRDASRPTLGGRLHCASPPLVQIGPASAIIDLRMMSACSAWSPSGDLDLREPQRILDDHAAALPAPILEGPQRDGDVGRAIDLLRKNNGVFDSNAGAGREMGRRRMHSVADEDTRPTDHGRGSKSVSRGR